MALNLEYIKRKRASEKQFIEENKEALEMYEKGSTHLKDEFLTKWILAPEQLTEKQRKSLDVHLGLCLHCRNRVDQMMLIKEQPESEHDSH
jgi:hypothetical protein